MPRFRKKPVEIEAIQFTGVLTSQVEAFLGDKTWEFDPLEGVRIATLEGVMTAQPYDWIIRGVQGELYPCKPNIFDQTYEMVD